MIATVSKYLTLKEFMKYTPQVYLQFHDIALIEGGASLAGVTSLKKGQTLFLDTNNAMDFYATHKIGEALPFENNISRQINRGTNVVKLVGALASRINYFFPVFEAFYNSKAPALSFSDRAKAYLTTIYEHHPEGSVLRQYLDHSGVEDLRQFEDALRQIVANNEACLKHVGEIKSIATPANSDLDDFLTWLGSLDDKSTPSYVTAIVCFKALTASQNNSDARLPFQVERKRKNTARDHLYLDLALYISKMADVLGVTGDINVVKQLGPVMLIEKSIKFTLDKSKSRPGAHLDHTGSDRHIPNLHRHLDLYAEIAKVFHGQAPLDIEQGVVTTLKDRQEMTNWEKLEYAINYGDIYMSGPAYQGNNKSIRSPTQEMEIEASPIRCTAFRLMSGANGERKAIIASVESTNEPGSNLWSVFREKIGVQMFPDQTTAMQCFNDFCGSHLRPI